MINLALAIGVVIVLFIGMAVKRGTQRLKSAAYFRERFFEAATKLANDRRTPDEIVEFSCVLSKLMGRGPLIRSLFVDIVRGRVQATPHSERAKKLRDLVRSLPEDLQLEWWTMVLMGIIAATYSSLIIGPVLRRLTLFPLLKQQDGGKQLAVKPFDGQVLATPLVYELAESRC